METVLIILGIVVIVIIVKILDMRTANKNNVSTYIKPDYRYSRKQSFISDSEKAFFKLLSQAAGDRYYIFPQVHLSTLFKNDTIGRYRKLAFQIINRRSVDYVLCDKDTLEPVYAVELDDPSHQRPDRQKRDQNVEQLFAANNLPLVRFSDYRNLSLDDIAKRFYDAHNKEEIVS